MRRWLALLVLLAGPTAAQTVIIYSRTDEAQAVRAERLLRVAGPTWRDRDLAPGLLWHPEIAARICRADRVLVLWSARAAVSLHVADELATAEQCGRTLVPVLLDNAPLAPSISAWQAVDWR
jgi:hypothetical protein